MNARVGWRVGLFCVLGGLCFTVPALSQGHFGWFWLSGVITAAALIPLVRFGARSFWAQFGSISLILVVIGLVCVLSEGVVFFPETRAQMLVAVQGGTVMYLIVAAALAGLAKLLKLTDPAPQEIVHRPGPAVAPLIVASAASYVLYYLIFGAIAFQFFTKQYYPHATDQVAAMGSWFWGYQLARGLLMTVAVLPVIFTLRLPRWQAALVAGILIWIMGGGAPLLVPNPLMVAAQRYMHIVEIMTQNVALGVTAGWLLRARAKTVAAPIERAVPA